MMERLTNNTKLGFQDSNKLPSYESLWDRLRYYEDLKENGKLPLLHIGDDIYFRVKGRNQFGEYVDFIQTQKISRININEDGILYCIASEKFIISDLGKTVFLTLDEAEEKLKEMK